MVPFLVLVQWKYLNTIEIMLLERKREKKNKKKVPGAQTMSDVIWACLLHETVVVVVARSIGVWMGDDRVVMAVQGGGRQ